MRQLTEPQAWREIARRISLGHWEEEGLCREAGMLEDDGRIRPRLCDQMVGRIEDHMDAQRYVERVPTSMFAFPMGEADVRVLAALFLAHEAEDDQ